MGPEVSEINPERAQIESCRTGFYFHVGVRGINARADLSFELLVIVGGVEKLVDEFSTDWGKESLCERPLTPWPQRSTNEAEHSG